MTSFRAIGTASEAPRSRGSYCNVGTLITSCFTDVADRPPYHALDLSYSRQIWSFQIRLTFRLYDALQMKTPHGAQQTGRSNLTVSVPGWDLPSILPRCVVSAASNAISCTSKHTPDANTYLLIIAGLQ